MTRRAACGAVVFLLVITAASARADTAHLDPSFGEAGVSDLSQTTPVPHQLFVERTGRIVLFADRFRGTNKEVPSAFALTPDGAIDPSFGPAGTGAVDLFGHGVLLDAVQTDDGKLLAAIVGIEHDYISSTDTLRFVRLLPDGDFDPTFGSDGVVDTGVRISDGAFMALAPDGRIVVTTNPEFDPAAPDFNGLRVLRFLPDGHLDESFSGDGESIVEDPKFDFTGPGPATVLGNGELVVVGTVTRFVASDFQFRSVLFGFRPDGQLDPRFGAKGIARPTRNLSEISDLTTTPKGWVITAGFVGKERSTGYGTETVYSPQVLALRPSGAPVRKFGDDGALTIHGAGLGELSQLAIAPDGAILAAGTGHVDWDPADGADAGDFLLVRLTRKGFLDRTFAPRGLITTDFAHGTDQITAFGIEPSGRIVAVGTTGYYYFRGPSTSRTIAVGYEPGRREPDADADGLENRADRCRDVTGTHLGCPLISREVSIRLLRAHRFTGTVRAARKRCTRSATVKVVRVWGSGDSVIGTDRDLSSGRYEIDAPSGPGRYVATVGRRLLAGTGICAAARSKPLVLNR